MCDFHGCGVGLDRFVVLVRCWELVFLIELGGESPFKVHWGNEHNALLKVYCFCLSFY